MNASDPGFPQQCPAHLFHTADEPSAEAFAAQLGASGSGGYTIRRQTGPRPPGWGAWVNQPAVSRFLGKKWSGLWR